MLLELACHAYSFSFFFPEVVLSQVPSASMTGVLMTFSKVKDVNSNIQESLLIAGFGSCFAKCILDPLTSWRVGNAYNLEKKSSARCPSHILTDTTQSRDHFNLCLSACIVNTRYKTVYSTTSQWVLFIPG